MKTGAAIAVLFVLAGALPSALAQKVKGVRSPPQRRAQSTGSNESPVPLSDFKTTKYKCKKAAAKAAVLPQKASLPPKATSNPPKEAGLHDPKANPAVHATPNGLPSSASRVPPPPPTPEECLLLEVSNLADVVVDCDAILEDRGPQGGGAVEWVSYTVDLDILKAESSGLGAIFNDMGKDLQTKVAPRVAGCNEQQADRRSRRLLGEENAYKIVNVDFGTLDLDPRGCTFGVFSNNATSAMAPGNNDLICLNTGVAVDVYYVGKFPTNIALELKDAMEGHTWNKTSGLLETSEVQITETTRSANNLTAESVPPLVSILGAVVSVSVVLIALVWCFKKNSTAKNTEVTASAVVVNDKDTVALKDKLPMAEAVALH